MAAVMAVKSIRQVSQGERLLAPSVANTSQSNGNQKQVAKFSLPMIKNIKLFCCEYFAEAPAVKQRATRPWRKRWAAYSVLCFNVLRVEMGTAVAPCIITAPKDSEPMITSWVQKAAYLCELWPQNEPGSSTQQALTKVPHGLLWPHIATSWISPDTEFKRLK